MGTLLLMEQKNWEQDRGVAFGNNQEQRTAFFIVRTKNGNGNDHIRVLTALGRISTSAGISQNFQKFRVVVEQQLKAFYWISNPLNPVVIS